MHRIYCLRMVFLSFWVPLVVALPSAAQDLAGDGSASVVRAPGSASMHAKPKERAPGSRRVGAGKGLRRTSPLAAIPSSDATGAAGRTDSAFLVPVQSAPESGDPPKKEGPNPVLGAALVCGAAAVGTCLCSAPGFLIGMIPGTYGIGALTVIPLMCVGGAAGSGGGAALNETVLSDDLQIARIAIPAAVGTFLAGATAIISVGVGVALGNIFESAELGVLSGAALTASGTLLTAVVTGGSYAVGALLVDSNPPGPPPSTQTAKRALAPKTDVSPQGVQVMGY